MKDDFLSKLVGSPARSQTLRVFMFNPGEPFTVAALAKRAGISRPAAEREVKAMEHLGIVKKGRQMSITLANGTKRVVSGKQHVPTWVVDAEFKHLRALSSFVHEVSPIKYESIVGALRRTGKLSAVILSGNFIGDETRPADLIVALDSLNERRLETAIKGLEPTIGREIRYAAFSTPEFRYRLTIQDRLMRDTLDYPHLVLLDKTRLL
jgi:hypothetical protein